MAFAQFLAHPDVVEDLTLRSQVGFLALHGGLEPGTSELAGAAAARGGASCYSVHQPNDLKHHVPSVEADP
ncbi:MAG TPA: poly-gamma-glutamate hydrolase family protein, partial [Acidimicrobiia bacterium]|nr:poly-gamma-glutamate hydrolase family protein [Acidimicrobiia bacterium]